MTCKTCGAEFQNLLPSWFDPNVPGLRTETKVERELRMQKLGVYCSHKCRLEGRNALLLAARCERYGITVEDYWQRFESQGGACAICRKAEPPGNNLAIDHCHVNGHARGLLCRRCNTALGGFEDDIERLLSAVEYLRAHRKL